MSARVLLPGPFEPPRMGSVGLAVRLLVLSAAIAVLGLRQSSAVAATLQVPAGYATIQAAIGSASPGDTVAVSPGTYYENLLIPAPGGVTLIGTGGATVTAVDGGGAGSVISVGPGAFATVLIEGLEIRNGSATQGAGLVAWISSVTVRRCEFRGNSANSGYPSYGGAAMLFAHIKVSTPMVIEECVFEENSAEDLGRGGAILSQFGQLSLIGNLFIGNTADVTAAVDAFMEPGQSIVMTRNTFVANACLSGATVRVEGYGTLSQNIIVQNEASGVECMGSMFISCNDVWDNEKGIVGCLPDTANFSADPMFCGPEDFRLDDGSPCLPGNHPGGVDCGVVGAYGACVVGVRSEHPVSARWGELKRRYATEE